MLLPLQNLVCSDGPRICCRLAAVRYHPNCLQIIDPLCAVLSSLQTGCGCGTTPTHCEPLAATAHYSSLPPPLTATPPAADGLRVRYHPNPLKKERPEDAQPMDTDFTFYVAWEGSDELEVCGPV